MSSSKSTIRILILSILAPFLFIIGFLTKTYIETKDISPPQYDVLLSHMERVNSDDNLQSDDQTRMIVDYTIKKRKGKLVVLAETDVIRSKKIGYNVLKIYRFNPETKKITPIEFDPYKSVIKKDKKLWTLSIPELDAIRILDNKTAPDGYKYVEMKTTGSIFFELLGQAKKHALEKEGKRIFLPHVNDMYSYTFTFHGWIDRN